MIVMMEAGSHFNRFRQEQLANQTATCILIPPFLPARQKESKFKGDLTWVTAGSRQGGSGKLERPGVAATNSSTTGLRQTRA